MRLVEVVEGDAAGPLAAQRDGLLQHPQVGHRHARTVIEVLHHGKLRLCLRVVREAVRVIPPLREWKRGRGTPAMEKLILSTFSVGQQKTLTDAARMVSTFV